MPKVSVIIPVYNVEKYLRECLDSIINQTLKDIEIICVNDGSTDGSFDILNKYAEKDDRIKVIDKENEGAGAARNAGLKIAAGDYVLFFDADDYMAITALEKLYKNITLYGSDISICGSYDFIDEEKEFKEITYAIRNNLLDHKTIFSPREIKKYVFQFCVGWPWDKLYRRNMLAKNNLEYSTLRNSEDTEFVLYSLVCADKISILREGLVFHRRHKNSVSNNRICNPICFYSALMDLLEDLKSNNLYEIYEQSFVNYCITFPLWHISTIKNKKAKNIMVKYFKRLLVKDIDIKNYDGSYFYNQSAYNSAKEILTESNNKFISQIFSIKNTPDKKHKVITILGLKIKIRRRNNNA